MKVYLPPSRKARIEMVPLIDTFFLLLAFFISAVITMESVGGVPVDLPKAGSTERIQRQGRLVITVGPGERLLLEKEPVSPFILQERLIHHPQRDTLQVAIHADQSTPYRRVVEVLSSVREAGVGRVILLTRPEKGR